MTKHSQVSSVRSLPSQKTALLAEHKALSLSRALPSAQHQLTPSAAAEQDQCLSAIPGRELIDKIDALGFTTQDMDEMMNAVQEGRKIEYERWSRKLFD